jgi:hypothetical protein
VFRLRRRYDEKLFSLPVKRRPKARPKSVIIALNFFMIFNIKDYMDLLTVSSLNKTNIKLLGAYTTSKTDTPLVLRLGTNLNLAFVVMA